MHGLSSHLFNLGYEHKILGNNELCYTMWYNFIVLNLYYLVVKELKFINNNNGDLSFKSLNLFYYQDCKVELLVNLENLKENLFTRLDQYLRLKYREEV